MQTLDRPIPLCKYNYNKMGDVIVAPSEIVRMTPDKFLMDMNN